MLALAKPTVIDFGDEADRLNSELIPYLGVVTEVIDTLDLCRLSIQDNVLRVAYLTEEVYLEEPLNRIKDWLPTDVFEEACAFSRRLAEEKMKLWFDTNQYHNVSWVSKTMVVVSQ